MNGKQVVGDADPYSYKKHADVFHASACFSLFVGEAFMPPGPYAAAATPREG